MGSSKREEIIEYTVDLISRYGYEGFSYKDLAEKFDVTKATIHHYFPKKEDLGQAICDYYRNVMAEFWASMDETDGAMEKLNRYLEQERRFMTDEMVCPFFVLLSNINLLPDAMKTELRNIAETELDMLAGIMEKDRKDGQLAFKGNSTLLALMFVSITRGSLTHSRAMQRYMTREVLDQFLDQIRV